MDIETLKQFSMPADLSLARGFYRTILPKLTESLSSLYKEQGSLFSLSNDDTYIFPAGDYTNGTAIDKTGEFEVIIASCNAQLSIANELYMRNVKRLKNKPKKMKELSSIGTFDALINSFASNLMKCFDPSTEFLLTSEGLKILCTDEYAFRLLIRFATFNKGSDSGILSFWDPLLKTSYKIDMYAYTYNFEKKNKETKGNFKRLVCIFKNIRKTILLKRLENARYLNKYFAEIMAYNIPNLLMQNSDLGVLFYKAVNYLINSNIYNLVGFDNMPIEDFRLAHVNFYNVKSFIFYLKKI